jgi:hypothetical protein
MLFKTILPFANLIFCALFVLLRQPAPVNYLRELDQARATDSIFETSGIIGTLACRNLYSWSEFHGGEALGVKVLEVVNAPALVVTAIASIVGEPGIARLMTACRWSWVLAGVFLLASSVQWWLLGLRLDRRLSRSRSR